MKTPATQPIEQHPLGFFLPENTKLLMLGSFPPPRARWSMNFYYPNIQNDMWRILGLVFYNDKEYFLETKKAFSSYSKITGTHCCCTGITLNFSKCRNLYSTGKWYNYICYSVVLIRNKTYYKYKNNFCSQHNFSPMY